MGWGRQDMWGTMGWIEQGQWGPKRVGWTGMWGPRDGVDRICRGQGVG